MNQSHQLHRPSPMLIWKAHTQTMHHLHKPNYNVSMLVKMFSLPVEQVNNDIFFCCYSVRYSYEDYYAWWAKLWIAHGYSVIAKNEKEIFGLKIIGSVHHLCVNSYSERSHNKSTWTVRWQHEKSTELSYYDEITMFSLTVLFTRGLCQAEKQCKPMYWISSKFLVFFFEQVNFGFFDTFNIVNFFDINDSFVTIHVT